MKYSVKRFLLGLNRFIAFACFLVTFIPSLEDYSGKGQYLYAHSIIWFILLLIIDNSKLWNVTDKRNRITVLGIIILSCEFLFWMIFVLVHALAGPASMGWNGYIFTAIMWALIGGVYLLLGLTKTKYDEGDKTIPYSD